MLKMTKIVRENQRGETPNADSFKRFSKIKLFQILGLLHRKFNNETLEFEPSLPLRLWFFVCFLSKWLLEVKCYVSILFPRNHFANLIIGNLFNYIPDTPRVYMAAVVRIGYASNRVPRSP